MNAEVDHLVIAAASLDEGAAWCEATFGVAPGPAGRHALMGTHNRLLALHGAAFPRSYLEIIAIDPAAPAPGRARWFGLDRADLQAELRHGPRLAQLVARTTHVEMLRWGLVNLGLNPGAPLAAERDTPQGKLAWRILVRDDGQSECGGRLPTLIEWSGRHPADALPASPLQLTHIAVGGLPPRVAALLRLRGVETDTGDGLSATIDSLLGPVTLQGWRPDNHD